MGLLQLTLIRRASLYMNTDKRNSTLSVGIMVANYIPSEFVFRLYLYVAELTLLTKNRSIIEIELNLVIALQWKMVPKVIACVVFAICSVR